jgi:hypothetical protein
MRFQSKTVQIVAYLFLIPGILFPQFGERNEFNVIKLDEAFAHKEQVNLSRFIDNVHFVPLETSSETIISQTALVDVSEEYIIVKNNLGSMNFQILLFERSSGKFLREISKNGRGPGEYHANSNIPFNQDTKEIYATSAKREVLAYNLSGKPTRKIKIPEFVDPEIPIEAFRRIMINPDHMLDNNIFCGYVINLQGWEKRKIILFSDSGVIKVFPNRVMFKKSCSCIMHFNSIAKEKFYKWNSGLYFLEPYCDTLYQVTKESMIPRYYFDWGKHNIPYSRQALIFHEGNYDNYFLITDINENNDFIFIRLYFDQKIYTAFVNKKENKITFCKLSSSGRSGLTDDISGLMEVMPHGFTEKNEMVYIIQPADLFKWFQQYPDKGANARARYPWLKDVDEFSNPVVAIGKCKN